MDSDSPTCADLAGNLVGRVASGRTGLATNSELLEEAVLADSRRATSRQTEGRTPLDSEKAGRSS